MALKAYTKGRPRISRHFCGDMLPDDATGSVYHGSPAHISRPLDLGQGGRCLRLHRRKGKAEEQISSWRMVVLCAETSTKLRLCAQATYQGMLFRTVFCHPERSRRRSEGSGVPFWLLGTDSSLPLRMSASFPVTIDEACHH